MSAALPFVSVGLPSRDLLNNVGEVVDAAVETLTIPDAQFRFRHVQPIGDLQASPPILDYEHRFAEHEHDWLLRGLV